MSWQLNVKHLCFFELSDSQIVSLDPKKSEGTGFLAVCPVPEFSGTATGQEKKKSKKLAIFEKK